MKTLRDFNLNSKKVLVRCDFNVPIDKKGNILDDFRIRQTLPTIKYLVENKARVILMSHLGEPHGEVVPELKLDKVGEKLAEYFKFPIEKENDCVGPAVEMEVNKLSAGRIFY